jgi:hypothetical protein
MGGKIEEGKKAHKSRSFHCLDQFKKWEDGRIFAGPISKLFPPMNGEKVRKCNIFMEMTILSQSFF